MEGFAGIVAPADGSFRGAGQKLAPTGSLSMEYAPLRRKGLRAVKSPSFTAHFFNEPQQAERLVVRSSSVRK